MITTLTNRPEERGAGVRWLLVAYDTAAFLAVAWFVLTFFPGVDWRLTFADRVTHLALGCACILACRVIAGVYKVVWRYIDAPSFIRLIIADAVGCSLWVTLNFSLPIYTMQGARLVCMACLSLLAAIAMRLVYQWMCGKASARTAPSSAVRALLRIAGADLQADEAADDDASTKVRIAIAGAGRVGTALAAELLGNPKAFYLPVCFIDTSARKAGRNLSGLPVLFEDSLDSRRLDVLGVQEVVLALPQKHPEDRRVLYERYRALGRKVKVYDYPLGEPGRDEGPEAGGRRMLRDFDIEELLFRDPIQFDMGLIAPAYCGRTVLVTGGGGSIGSELCRQVAKMSPKRIVVLDIAENGAYELQQELRRRHGGDLDVVVEICSVCDRAALGRIFALHRPDVVLHAAAHKHVPLMERNCVEAVANNVFGTQNAAELSAAYGVDHFVLISTDKAVNPTNVMGATKRMCEMIVQCLGARQTGTVFSAVRFGNVLGSAGSVVPLFKSQILAGGPVTLTDRRIVRFFMTIPEASQLVLQSATFAESGELFVLDMGEPVRIADLAENMIRLMGFEPGRDIEILETGLRPGEKLYEELLIESEDLDATDSDRIFIERDEPLTEEALCAKLDVLRAAVESGVDDKAREALRQVVPTYHRPEEVNSHAEEALRAGAEAAEEAKAGKRSDKRRLS